MNAPFAFLHGFVHSNRVERKMERLSVCVRVRNSSSTLQLHKENSLVRQACIHIHTQGNHFNIIQVIMMIVIKLKKWSGQSRTVCYAYGECTYQLRYPAYTAYTSYTRRCKGIWIAGHTGTYMNYSLEIKNVIWSVSTYVSGSTARKRLYKK